MRNDQDSSRRAAGVIPPSAFSLERFISPQRAQRRIAEESRGYRKFGKTMIEVEMEDRERCSLGPVSERKLRPKASARDVACITQVKFSLTDVSGCEKLFNQH